MVHSLVKYFQICTLHKAMKNLVNYLDDYFDDNIEENLSNRKFKNKMNISKDEANEWQRKANRKASREEEIEAHGKPINHSHTFRDRTKYTRKDKHKNTYR